MKIKYLKYVLALFVVITFTACGGGGSGGSAEFSGTTQEIDVVLCSSGTIDTYTELLSGDTIVKLEDPTVINTYHDIDGNKLICVDTGSAKIVR